MKKFNFFIEKKYNFLTLITILLFSLLSLHIYQFVYDGHHHGLMLSNAIDLLNLKKPYTEIYIQYGFLTTIIHAIALILFGNNLFSLHLVTVIFYSFSIFFIFLIVKELINKKIASITVFFLLFNHPVPWLPWSNYIAYFFIILSIFFIIKKSNYNYLWTGLFLGFCVLARQDYFIPIFITLFIYNLIYLLIDIKINKLFNSCKIIVGFITPIFFFFLYLYSNGLFIIWKKYLILPSLYLELNNVSILDYIINYIKFFLSDSFINFVNMPQYLLISIILIINTLFLTIFIARKQYSLIFISVMSLSLSSVGISTELFRLYTSVSVGIVVLVYIISNTKSNYVRKFSFFFLLSISIFSFTFYPLGNNKIFKKINIINQKNTPKSLLFTHNKWLNYKVSVLDKINHLKENILNNCKIEYAENLTFDNYFTNILNLNRVRLVPHIKADVKNLRIDKFFNENFISRINSLILQENIIILVTGNNHIYESGNIIFNDMYTFKEIYLNSLNTKPQLLRFYYPSKCNIKS